MEKRVGILNDQDGDVTKALLDAYGQAKYKIHSGSMYGSHLVFQTNDKELFLQEWKKIYRPVMGRDGIELSFEVNGFQTIGGCMNVDDLRKYLDEHDNQTTGK